MLKESLRILKYIATCCSELRLQLRVCELGDRVRKHAVDVLKDRHRLLALEDRNMTGDMATRGPQRSTADECPHLEYRHRLLDDRERLPLGVHGRAAQLQVDEARHAAHPGEVLDHGHEPSARAAQQEDQQGRQQAQQHRAHLDNGHEPALRVQPEQHHPLPRGENEMRRSA